MLILYVRVSYTDIKYRKIGKGETLMLALLAFTFHQDPLDSLAGALCVAGITELVNLIASDLKGIGGGDIRLLFDTGLALGYDLGLYALLGSMSMALVYVVWCRCGQKTGRGNKTGRENEAGSENKTGRENEAGSENKTGSRTETGSEKKSDRGKWIPLGPFISLATCVMMLAEV